MTLHCFSGRYIGCCNNNFSVIGELFVVVYSAFNWLLLIWAPVMITLDLNWDKRLECVISEMNCLTQVNLIMIIMILIISYLVGSVKSGVTKKTRVFKGQHNFRLLILTMTGVKV